MTPYRARRMLLTIAMIVACLVSSALWIAYAGQPLTKIRIIALAWAPIGVAWAWFSSEGMARRRNKKAAAGEPVAEDQRQYGRLILVTFLGMLAFGDIVIFGQAFDLLSHDLNALAPRALLIMQGIVTMIWGDRRAKLTDDPAAGSVPGQRRAAWAMVLFGAGLVIGSFLLPPMMLVIGAGAGIIALAALQIMTRRRAA